MKQVIDITLGKIQFTLEEDAYYRLKAYLESFEGSLPNNQDRAEIMEDIESRIAELFQQEIKFPRQVIVLRTVEEVIATLGEVDNSGNTSQYDSTNSQTKSSNNMESSKKFYRNPDDKKLGGVCSGIAAYFNIDPTIVRILFIVFILSGGSGILAYVILWIIMDEADTVAKKLQMRGIEPTAENIKNFNP